MLYFYLMNPKEEKIMELHCYDLKKIKKLGEKN